MHRVMKMDRGSPSPDLALPYLPTFDFYNSESEVRNDSGYPVLWNCGGRTRMGGQVRNQAETTLLFLLPLHSFRSKHLISHLVVISRQTTLGTTISTEEKLQFDRRQIVLLSIHFHPCKADSIVLVFSLPYMNLRGRKVEVYGVS